MGGYSSEPVGSTVQSCPLKQDTHWIEIELVGEDASPVPWEEYRIQLPNEDIVHGFVDDQGRARVENLPAGECQVCFPRLDKDAWTKVEASGSGG